MVGLAAGDNAERLAEQAQRFRPAVVALATGEAADRFRAACPAFPGTVLAGGDALVAVASDPAADIVLCASSGTAGLEAVMAAIESGKRVALANKEVLVMAGELVTSAARRRGVSILPVDSEHNAIHQCLHGRAAHEVRRLILTASGGPFRDLPLADLDAVGPDAALRHPTWQMGRKITIDSATLMNKGLEIIEARWLFDVAADQIDVVIHPQSVVHSMVELVDGSLIAQLGVTDMRLPIQYAFSYPERWTTPLPSLDLARAGRLEFHEPDQAAFPCLALARRALRAAPSEAVVLNAANEIAVALFLEGRIGFTAIAQVIEQTLNARAASPVTTLADVRSVDTWARECSREVSRGVELRV